MADENNIENTEPAPKSRRDFVKTSAQVAVTAPAVAVLLSASTKKALAGDVTPYQASASHILDDFSFGNDREDIDSHVFGSNYNPDDGEANKDDHV